MRLFAALEIPSTVRENLAALLESLRAVSPQTRWVRPQNLHVTLKFMGEVPETKLAATCSALAGVRSDSPRSDAPRESTPLDKSPHHLLVIALEPAAFQLSPEELALSAFLDPQVDPTVGAKLRLALVRDGRSGRNCEVVWRRGGTVGIKFVR